jgi:response regulator RpfG family c-di-GMP phosphodiesterase
MVLYSIAILCLVWTTDYCDIFYRDVTLASENGISYLIKDYGPAHILHVAQVFGYSVAIMTILVYALIKKKSVSQKTIIKMALFQLITAFAYSVERYFESKIEVLPIAFVLSVILIVEEFNKMAYYDASTSMMIAHKSVEAGYIFFDQNMRFLTCNNTAYKYFSELNNNRVDHPIKNVQDGTLKELLDWLNAEKGNSLVTDTRIYPLGDKVFQFSINPMNNNRGCILEFVDDTEEQKYLKMIENYNKDLEKKVEEKTEDIRRIQDKLVLSMAMMVESRDNSTGGHIRRTSDVVEVFSKKLLEYAADFHVDEKFLALIVKAAPMHDLGKIAVDDAILRKNGKYDDNEYAQMKKHSEAGAKIVRTILTGAESEDFINIATNVAHYHHEKWDGTGYPCGLSHEQIPLEARIMALADVFDALASKRCYKEAFSLDKAFSIIMESLGQHFDPDLGQLFLRCRPELEQLYTIYPD